MDMDYMIWQGMYMNGLRSAGMEVIMERQQMEVPGLVEIAL